MGQARVPAAHRRVPNGRCAAGVRFPRAVRC